MDKIVENICYYFDKNQLIIDQINGKSSLVATTLSDNEIKITQRKKVTSTNNNNNNNMSKATGIFGVYKLPYGNYVAVIKSSIPAPNYVGVSDVNTFNSKVDPLLLQMASNVHQIKELEFILVPSSANNHNLTIQMRQQEEILLLQDAFSRHNFYYYKIGARKGSAYYDVTKSLQANMLNIYNETSNSDWKGCDERFFWNFNAVHDIINIKNVNSEWIVPVTNAWISSGALTFDTGSKNGKESFVLSLVSRRSRLRQGPRYIKRGSDKVGDVANFVETEQILVHSTSGKVASFLQIRGSIPLFWGQPEVWKLKPSIIVERDLTSHATALKTHLLNIVKSYRPASIYMINLIDKVGTQGELGKWLHAAFDRLQRGDIESFQTYHDVIDQKSAKLLQNIANINSKIDCIPMKIDRIPGISDRSAVTAVDYYCPLNNAETRFGGSSINSINNIKLIWFDYHKKCKKSNIDSLKEIHTVMNGKMHSKSIDNDGHGSDYFSFNDKDLLTLQNNIIRTNCIDCLDRTNVVQSTVARWALIKQLKSCNSRLFDKLSPDSLSLNIDTTGVICSAESVFRRIWGDNGDNLSLLYAGTYALKRDVTRQGMRTNKGAFDDGVNSAVRYFINNYKDAQRQKGIDLIIGTNRNRSCHIDHADTQNTHENMSIVKKKGNGKGKRSSSKTIDINYPINITFTPVSANYTRNGSNSDTSYADDFAAQIDNLFSEMRQVIDAGKFEKSVARKKLKKKRVLPKSQRISTDRSSATSRERATVTETESPLKFLINNFNSFNEFLNNMGANANTLAKFIIIIILLMVTKSKILVK